jgi:hypothetical protein
VAGKVFAEEAYSAVCTRRDLELAFLKRCEKQKKRRKKIQSGF